MVSAFEPASGAPSAGILQRPLTRIVAVSVIAALLAAGSAQAIAANEMIDIGSRPGDLIDRMEPGKLRDRLDQCRGNKAERTDFSIGHRGAPLRFPEHTLESYQAAARQGAGILECDVTFTSDRELVCRHSQCDLHTTTNILEIPHLAAKCSEPFTPWDAASGKSANARCCTSDLTLAEFRELKGKVDNFNPRATTVAEYVAGVAGWRGEPLISRGTLMTHAESIALFAELGVKMTPELKSPQVKMPWQGNYTQQDYAQQMIDEYRAAKVKPGEVWVQSFNLDDLKYWIENEPEFAKQAVYLDRRVYARESFRPSEADFERLRREGVEIVAPPMFALLALSAEGKIVPSKYAELARAAQLDIITWTIERSDLRHGAVSGNGKTTFYYRGIGEVVTREGDLYKALDVLAKDVGIEGIFSDWPATVTFYANCMGIE